MSEPQQQPPKPPAPILIHARYVSGEERAEMVRRERERQQQAKRAWPKARKGRR